MTNLNLEIISLGGIVFKGQCHLAVIPAANGAIGVMYDHESIITSLKEGKIEIFDDKQNLVKEFDVKGGFAEMHAAEKLVVLID
mgnify:CR=1 FL=1